MYILKGGTCSSPRLQGKKKKPQHFAHCRLMGPFFLLVIVQPLGSYIHVVNNMTEIHPT